MNSSVNPPASVNPSGGITSFTNDDGGSTSLSSALAETVANLACFGSSVRDANASGAGASAVAPRFSQSAAAAEPAAAGELKHLRKFSVANPLNGAGIVRQSNNLQIQQQPQQQAVLPRATNAQSITQQKCQGGKIAKTAEKHQGTLSQNNRNSKPPAHHGILPPVPALHPNHETSKSIINKIQRINKPQSIANNNDSMSHTVASLAQMSNFATPRKHPILLETTSHSAPVHHHKSLNTTSSKRHERSLSGPIVSGTAFSAVVALQKKAGSPSTNEGKNTAPPPPSTLKKSPLVLPSKKSQNSSEALEQIALVSNSIGKRSTPPKKIPTSNNKVRHSDGAPIIAGTAAAAMAIATAARIATSSEGKNATLHGFGMLDTNCMQDEESLDRMVSLSTKAVLGMEQGAAKDNVVRITPEENVGAGSASVGVQIQSSKALHQRTVASSAGLNIRSSQPLHHQQKTGAGSCSTAGLQIKSSRPLHQQSSTAAAASLGFQKISQHHSVGSSSTAGFQIKSSQPLHQQSAASCSTAGFKIKSSLPLHQKPLTVTLSSSQPSYLNASHMSSSTSNAGRSPLGGMDILADIICHVPPMAVPESSAQSNPYSHNSYHPPQHHHYPIQKSVPAIPSYQEIYQEMGIAPQHTTTEYQYNKNEVLLQYSYPRPSYSVETISRSDADPSQQQRLPYHYGHPPGSEIEEGKELYTRKDLLMMGGHLFQDKDVHGSMKEGADSVVLCNLERDIREADGLCWFLYSCDRTNGGAALCRSYHKRRAIRVFRSSSLNGKFASPYLDEDEDDEIGYRYDGLYMVRAVWDVHGNETEAFPSTGAEGWQTYFFTRLPKKPLDGRTEPGMQYNSMGLQELWGSIQKMRGVRRPKKFEIPQAPMTLPPMKMSAITGDFRDRKSATYRPPVVQEPIQEKTLPEKASNDGRKKQPEPPLFDSSSDEEAPEQPRGAAKRSESTSPSRSERSPKIAPRPIPNKVVTPRPRLSSNAQELKKTATSLAAKRMASTESDSSDSESEHPVHPKRPKVEYPKLVSSSPTKRPNNLAQVISTLLPKRATAAKAEAANRDMLGKKKKRPSSRSSTSAASSPRKRPRRSKQDDDSSSLSINGVDPDILTVGSRVLVQYKGSLFKATIRKRREKNGKHDFQIHYDGNKKSNVHWVAVDRIDKILYIAIDTSAATKSVGNKKSKRGGWNKKKSESDEENDTDHSDDESVHSKEMIESKTAASPKRKPEETEEEPEETEVKPEETEAKPEEEHAKPSGESSSVPAKPARGSPASVRSKPPLEDDDTEEVSTVAASKGSDEEMLRKETNETIATTSTNNFKRNRVTVFDDVQVARGMCNSPSKRNILLNKSFTLSSDGVDVPSLDGDAASTKEEPDQSSELADGETQEAGDSVVDLKFPIGTHVYVEYRRIFYSSTILQTRQKRKLREYLVHYEGYKKASDRWVKESNLHEVNAETTRRFDEQRLTSSNIALQPDLSGPADSSMTTRGKTNDASDDQSHQHFTRQKKPPSRTRSDASDATKLVDIESGVAFLPGSVVFVELSGALYLAKMVKKRFSGERTEYLVSYDGYDSDYDAWNPIHTIYEVNPQTKRVFNKMNADIKSGIQSKRPDPPKNKPERKKRDSTSTRSSTTVQVEAKSVTKEVFSSPPLPRRRGGRKNDDNDDSISTSDQASKQSSAAAAAQASFSPVDMQGIPPGVEFLPGSTLFAQRNGALCLAKMLKKRGKGDFMEYFVQFNDGTDNNESLWVSTALVYEINPQTKRMFRQLSNNKS